MGLLYPSFLRGHTRTHPLAALESPSTSHANCAQRPADPEDAPGRKGDAAERDARDVHHRFEPDIIGRDANVAFGRGPAARATAAPTAFVHAWVAFRLLATAPP